jgi:hypothetical protein
MVHAWGACIILYDADGHVPAMSRLTPSDQGCGVQVRFDLVDGESDPDEGPSVTGTEHAAGQQPKSRALTIAPPAPKEVSQRDIERGIQWPQPSEKAFWERPPRTEPVSLGMLHAA